jgi:hypothetical protein
LDYSLDVNKPSLGQVVEVFHPMFEFPTNGRLLHGKSNFLECNSPVFVFSENLNAGFVQRAEKAPLARSLIVVTDSVVISVPHRFVLSQFVRSKKNAQIVARDRLVTSLPLRRRVGDLRSLAGVLNRCGPRR